MSKTTSRRPALRKFTSDLSKMRGSLLGGFHSRPALLRWMQELTVRTLGQVPQERYHQFGEEFIPDSNGEEGVLLAALLTPSARVRALDSGTAMKLREDWSSRTIAVARHPGFRELRKNAGDYVGEMADEDGHDPEEQSHTAMRPALDELHDHQRTALDRLLDGGLVDRGEILEWGDDVELAAHGEPVDPEHPGEFVTRCFQQDSTADLLTKSGRAYDRARQAFAAQWLLPAFNRGVGDLIGRTGEEPRTDTEVTDNEPPDWGT